MINHHHHNNDNNTKEELEISDSFYKLINQNVHNNMYDDKQVLFDENIFFFEIEGDKKMKNNIKKIKCKKKNTRT